MPKLNYDYYLMMMALLINGGCKSVELINPMAECPATPNSPLRSENIELISLANNELIELSSTASQESRGYQFSGEAGQTLSYKTSQNLCIWIYSPDNQLLKSEDLPMAGNYVIQISSPKSQEFQLSLGLDVGNTNNTSSTSNPFKNVSFPQSSCGDSKPSDSSLTSVQFYPVNIPYSEKNLEIVTENFCRDAYEKKDKSTGEIMIQVSSFIEESKAQEFAEFLGENITGAYVGKPTTIYLNN